MLSLPSLLNNEIMAPVSAWRYISPRSATTGAAVVWTLIRLSPEEEVYLIFAKDTHLHLKWNQKTLKHT